MTLSSFPPPQLDALALRLLDVAALVRKMAALAREQGMNDFQLHGNKAHEWLAKLEGWAIEAELRVQSEALRQKGTRRALAAAEIPAAKAPRNQRAGRKRQRV